MLDYVCDTYIDSVLVLNITITYNIILLCFYQSNLETVG